MLCPSTERTNQRDLNKQNDIMKHFSSCSCFWHSKYTVLWVFQIKWQNMLFVHAFQNDTCNCFLIWCTRMVWFVCAFKKHYKSLWNNKYILWYDAMVKDWLGLILTDKQATTIYHLQPLAMFFFWRMSILGVHVACREGKVRLCSELSYNAQ